MKLIKSLLLVAAAMFTTATYAQVDNRFSFVDKNGKEIPSGSVWTTHTVKDDGMREMIDSEVFVKNNSSEKAAAGIYIKVEKIDNGSMQICFPMNCQGDITTSASTPGYLFKPGEIQSSESEWVFDEDGSCTVTYKLESYIVTEDRWGKETLIKEDEVDMDLPMPSITVVFVKGATAINGVKDGENVEVAAIYDATGKQIQTTQKGLNIVKLTNGKTVKIVK